MSYLKKLGIKVRNNSISYRNRTISLKDVDFSNLYESVLRPLGIRKTRGTDFYDGKQFIKPSILKELKTKIKTFAVTIKFDWINATYKNVYENRITSFVTRTINDDVLQAKAMDAAIEYAQSRSIPESGDNIEIENIEIVDKRSVTDTDLKELPFFGATLTYPKLGLKTVRNTGLCGYDLLLKNYKSKAKSIEQLESFFDKKRIQGLTANDLYKFCEHHNIPYYATDLRKKCILKLSNADDNRLTKALIVTIANQHCYEITDKTLRLKIQNGNRSVSSTFKTKQKKDERESIYVKEIPQTLDQNKKYFVDQDNLNSYYLNLLENQKCYPSKYMQDDVTEIHFETSKLSVASKFEEMKEAANILNIPYTNQSPAKLSREYFDTVKGDWKESTPNSIIRKYMESDAMKAGAFDMNLPLPQSGNELRSTQTTKYPKNHKLIGIDQTKQYTSVAIRGDFHYVDADDEVYRYNGENIESGCFYYVANSVVFPMNGNGFFDYQVVAAYLEYGLITKDDIKFYFTTKKQPDVFPTFINNVYKTKQGKTLTNLLIGSFNIIKNKYATANYIVDNWAEAGYYYHLTGKNTNISTIITKNGPLHRIQGFEERNKLSNGRLVYMSIVQRANLETYKLLKYTETLPNFIPVKIKSDCIIGAYDPKRGKPKIATSTAFGAMRIETKIPEIKKMLPKTPRDQMQVFVDRDWRENPLHRASKKEYYNYLNILKYWRVFILGFAGSAKSYMINQLRKKLTDRFAYLSFTHTAANNIDGQTAHSFYGMSIDGVIDERKIRDILNTKEGIIIDEINQLPLCIYRILCAMPKSFKIYGFGDPRQELPVNEESYLDTQMFRSLFDSNMIKLKKQCRADAKFANAAKKYHDTEDFDILKPFIQRPPTNEIATEWQGTALQAELTDDINITKTNLMRKTINRILMTDKSDGSSQLIAQDKLNNPYSQDMYLYEGLPVIATKTHRNLQMYNNEMYVVESYDEKQVCLRFRKLNKNEKRNKTLTLSYQEFARCFAPAYALTTYKIEGATIDMPFTIWEFNKMGIKSQYTALTRATDASLISINECTEILKDRDEVGKLGSYTCYIYKVTDGEKVYVGSTIQALSKRLEQHKNKSKTERSKLYRYMRKHCEEDFTIEQLHKFTAKSYRHQLEIEEYYIELEDSVNKGLNTKYF